MNSHKNNPDVRTMLESMYEILIQRFPDALTAWDRLMEFLILDHRPLCFVDLNDSIEWLFDGKLIDELMAVYDSELLRQNYYDHLGDMYFERVISSQQAQEHGQTLASMQEVQKLAEKQVPKTGENKAVFDPAVGTGRRLMAAHRVAPEAILFGVDRDIRLLRIALTNYAIHDIQGFLLHADFDKHNTDIATEDGEYNWQYANKWHSCMNELRVIDKDSKEKGGTKL